MAFDTPKYTPSGNERELSEVESIDSRISNADNRNGTKLSTDELRRTAALTRTEGNEVKYLPKNAVKYRQEVGETVQGDIDSYRDADTKILRKMDGKIKAVENVYDLIQKHKKDIPDQYKPIVKLFTNMFVDPKTETLIFVEKHKKSREKLLNERTAIQNILDKTTDRTALADAINTVWPVDLSTIGTGEIDAQIRNDVQLAVAKKYTELLAGLADTLTTDLEALPLDTILQKLNLEQLATWQDQRDIILSQHPERAAFLNRIAGAATVDELITASTRVIDNKEKIDVRYLAYYIRWEYDAKSSTKTELKYLQEALGITATEFFIDPVPAPTKDNPKRTVQHEKIEAYLKRFPKPINPIDVEPKHLLLRMRFDEKQVVNKLLKDEKLLQALPLKTLLLFRGLEPNVRAPNVASAIVKIIQKDNPTKDELIDILTFLRFKMNTGEEWAKVRKEAEKFYNDALFATGAIEEDVDKKISFAGKDDAERTASADNIAGALVGPFETENVSIISSIIKEENVDLPWEKDVEFMAKPIADVATNGFNYWLEVVKKAPNDFRFDIPGDDKLMEDNIKSDLLGKAISAFSALKQTDAKDAEVTAINTLTKENEKKRTKLNTAADGSDRVLDQKTDADDLVKISRYVHNQLKEAGLEEKPVAVQDMAFWIAMHKDVATAKAYMAMKKPDINVLANLTDTERADIMLDFRMLSVQEQLRGADSLMEMKNELGVTVNPHALDILDTLKGPDGITPLSAGPSRIDQWFVDPKNSHLALNAILVSDTKNVRAKGALIRAFSNGKSQTYSQEGVTKTITLEDAQETIRKVQNHLKTQKEDYRQSTFNSQRKERFGNPLDILHNGKDALGEMLQSGDKVQQGLAIAMIVSSAWLLYRTWTKGGNAGKALVAGIPLFFGSDIMLRKMTGKGVLERLGLRFMNEEDRTMAVEQFRRKYEQMPRYSYLQTPVGTASMRALTSPKHPIPIEDLLAWRLSFGANARATYANSMPDSPALKAATGRVMGQIPGMDRNNEATREARENASEFLFLSFEALCVEIAERNNLPEPRSETGAKFLEDRYVTFTDKRVGQYGAMMKDIAEKQGGFTMLDVLTRERATPATQELLFKDDTFLEWVLRGTGIAIEEAKTKLSQNISLAQIYAEHGLQVAPEYLESAQIYLAPKAKAIYDYLRLEYTKHSQALKEETYAALRLVTSTLSTLGVIVTENGPNAVQWTWETGVFVGRKGVDALQNVYRIMHKYGLLTGPAIDFIDRTTKSITGYRMSDIILFESALASADPKQIDAHVDHIAAPEKWNKDFFDQLSTITTGVDKDLLNNWVAEAKGELALTATDSYSTMLTYELVKRRVYSYLLQKGAASNGTKVPLAGLTLAGMQKGATDIESSYGLHTLRLLRSQNNDWDVYNWSLVPAIAGGAVDTVLNKIPQATIYREEARQYLVALDEFYTKFTNSAYAAFPGNSPENVTKRKEYDAFLQTVLANAVIDITLSQSAGQNAIPGTSARTLAVPPENAAVPFKLNVDQAQAFLEYLRAERGNSADAQKLKNTNFTKFTSNGDFQKIQRYVPQVHKNAPSTTASGSPALKPEERRKLDTALNSTSTDPQTMKDLLLAKSIAGLEPALYANAIARIDKVTADLISGALPIASNTETALVALQGTNNRQDLRDNILDAYKGNALPLIELGAKMREESKFPEILNDLLDRAVVPELENLLKDIRSVKIDAVLSNGKQAEWQQKLLALYNGTKSPKVRDTVSILLEYVLYQEKNKSIPVEGRAGYAKYLKFLQERGVKSSDFPPANAWYWSTHSKDRMDDFTKVYVTEAILDPTYSSLGVDNLRSNSIGDKIIVLKHELGIQ